MQSIIKYKNLLSHNYELFKNYKTIWDKVSADMKKN